MKRNFIIIVVSLFLLLACSEGKQLDSVKVYPENGIADEPIYYCSNATYYVDFVAMGYYDDDSKEDFTSEVTWSFWPKDATADDIISDSGMVICQSDLVGKTFKITATYKLESGTTTSNDDNSETELTGDAIVTITD